MNVTFMDPDHEVKKEEVIVVDGEEVGFLKEGKSGSGTRPFHAGIRLGRGSMFLIQGWGDTKQEAIANALSKGRSDAKGLLADIKAFENKISS